MPVFTDGAGGEHSAGVSKDLKGQVLAAIDKGIAAASLRGDAYAWCSVTYDQTADDTILIVRNNDPDRLLVIDRAWMWTDVAGKWVLHCPATGLTIDGTAVVGVNLNKSSARVAKATATTNETTNAVVAIVANVYTPDGSALQGTTVELNGAVVLGYDQSFALDCAAAAADTLAWVWGYYVDAA